MVRERVRFGGLGPLPVAGNVKGGVDAVSISPHLLLPGGHSNNDQTVGGVLRTDIGKAEIWDPWSGSEERAGLMHYHSLISSKLNSWIDAA